MAPAAVDARRVLVLPGYGDSGPDHWQTLWERRHGYLRVQQDDWLAPRLPDWLGRLERAIADAPGPVTLVAHSLGCVLAAHAPGTAWARHVHAALLVAPPDVDEVQHYVPEVASFAPVPMALLPFQAIVVSSTTDPYVEPARARAMAAAWGALYVDAGDAGHLNAESQLGEWPAGHRLLEDLLATS